jgi:hypothetical protein
VGRPQVDDALHPQRLVGGSVILGEVCGSAPLQAAHLGVDAGPLVVRDLYKGVKSNGIYLPNHGSFNPKRGTHLADVSVLTNDLDGQHSVLIEGEEEALLEGLWIWTPGGTHGLVLKSAHSVVRDFHCKGAASDCLLVKSDYKTTTSSRTSTSPASQSRAIRVVSCWMRVGTMCSASRYPTCMRTAQALAFAGLGLGFTSSKG